MWVCVKILTKFVNIQVKNRSDNNYQCGLQCVSQAHQFDLVDVFAMTVYYYLYTMTVFLTMTFELLTNSTFMMVALYR